MFVCSSSLVITKFSPWIKFFQNQYIKDCSRSCTEPILVRQTNILSTDIQPSLAGAQNVQLAVRYYTLCCQKLYFDMTCHCKSLHIYNMAHINTRHASVKQFTAPQCVLKMKVSGQVFPIFGELYLCFQYLVYLVFV